MSRYFNIFQKSLEQINDYPSELLERAEESVERACQPPEIPVEEVRVHPESRVVFSTDPRSPGADRFRFLRMRLREIWNAGKLRSLLITSPLPGDGKSTIALNLATALSEKGQRAVLLVDGDLHKSALVRQLGIRKGPGLADCLENGLNPMSAVRRLEPLGWYFLSSGNPRAHPTELLQGEVLPAVLQDLSAYFDWILIDAPPVIPLTDALSLARRTDGSLLVVRAERTSRDAVHEAVRLLGHEHVIGVLLNGVGGLNRLYSKYHGYYGTKASSPSVCGPEKQDHSG